MFLHLPKEQPLCIKHVSSETLNFLFCDDVIFKQKGNIDFDMNIDYDSEFSYPDFSDQVVIQPYMFEHQSNAPRHGLPARVWAKWESEYEHWSNWQKRLVNDMILL